MSLFKEKLQFYYQANASMTELKNQILVARDVRYMEISQKLIHQVEENHKLLFSLINSTKQKINK